MRPDRARTGRFRVWFPAVAAALAACLASAGVVVGDPDGGEPAVRESVAVLCGELVGCTRTSGAVDWLDPDRVFLKNLENRLVELPEGGEQSREPAAGKVFVILTFRIEPGKSLSRFDYRLSAGGTVCEPLALAESDLFDFRILTFRCPPDAGQDLRMLFEVPAAARTVDLEFVPAVPVPHPPVKGLVPGDGQTVPEEAGGETAP